MGIAEKLGKMGIPGFRSGKKWKMAIAVFGYFMIAMFILGLIVGSPPQQATSRAGAANPTITERAPVDIAYTPIAISTPKPTVAPITLSGRGQKATDLFYLPQGLVRFEMNYDGDSNFAIWLMDDQGRKKELLVNEIGTFEGSKALGIEKSGMYLLDITADGSWKVTIR